jgi:L-alanine-DL-glutamate epimerase-like enolase superfamily enzyme
VRIERIDWRRESFALTRPYAIAGSTTDTVDNVFISLFGGGAIGLGVAAPVESITGEKLARCEAALDGANQWLCGRTFADARAASAEVKRHTRGTPSAGAALDMAIFDLAARSAGVPLLQFLGAAHRQLPTSITIGIKPTVGAALAEADEYLGRGFRHLKLKLGGGAEHDLELCARLRERVGADTEIRVDMNQSYTVAQLLSFVEKSRTWRLELLEQPLPAGAVAEMRALPEEIRAVTAADESLLDEDDADDLLAPPRAFGIFNIKLMKCGGIGPALRIGERARQHGIALMWGCMDESRIGIAAALHAALACPATRYLDLDGSLDLARDLVDGGFWLQNGVMGTLDRPGLGVVPIE